MFHKPDFKTFQGLFFSKRSVSIKHKARTVSYCVKTEIVKLKSLTPQFSEYHQTSSSLFCFQDGFKEIERPDHLSSLRDAVILEQRAAYESIIYTYHRSNVASLKRRGAVLMELQASSHANFFRMMKVILKLKKIQALPRHRFSDGDLVTLTRMNEDWSGELSTKEIDQRKCDVVVHCVRKEEIEIMVNASNRDRFLKMNSNGSLWRMDIRFQNTVSSRQIMALDKLSEYSWKTDSISVLQAKILGLRLYDKVESRLLPQWQKSTKLVNLMVQEVENDSKLNSSQKEAIKVATQQRITLWQGPPGSGKTHTLLAFLRALCQASRQFPKFAPCPILVCAETNAAVDNLVYGLLKRRIRVVRIGLPSKTRDILLSSTLDARAEKTNDGVQHLEMLKKIDKLKQLARETEDPGFKKEIFGNIKHLQSLSEKYFQQACDHIINTSEVVACTCISAGANSLFARNFQMVVIDEATQSTEPSTLVPLLMGAESLIMAGDPKQLPPTVHLTKAAKLGLDQSLFVRLAKTGIEPVLLDTQYRMHPEICCFPSFTFYEGRLKTDDTCWTTDPPRWFSSTVNGRRVVFVESSNLETRSTQKQTEASLSYRNEGDCQQIIKLLKEITSYQDVKDIALLTPYKGQEILLDQHVQECIENLGKVRIYVSTVDGFQGREADIVIFNTVRCNPKKKLGFVANAGRMNVAITRAKKGIIVVGNRATLSSDKLWRNWFKWLQLQTQT